MMRILIAPNAFKDSLTAEQAAMALTEGLQASGLACTIDCFPIGDGGDGTISLLTKQLKLPSVSVDTVDPLGRPLKVAYGYNPHDAIAYIEMAAASGIHLLTAEELNPMRTNTVGTGMMIMDALNRGAKHIVLGIGGSATVDGGCGVLHAMGANFVDKEGMRLEPYPEQLLKLWKIDLSDLDERIEYCRFTLLTDVKNKLLGKRGAAFVFGPQKGASDIQVEMLDDALEHLNCVWMTQFKKDASRVIGGGAAGGLAAGLWAMLDAELLSGIDYFLQVTNFEKRLNETDLLITGEGAIDLQTLDGKGPYGVASRAKARGINVIGVAGNIPLIAQEQMDTYFDLLIPIGHGAFPLEKLKRYTFENLKRTGKMIGKILQIGAEKTIK